MIDQEEIIRIAREQLKTPFKHQGRRAGVALDCGGLMYHVLASLNLPYNDLKGYARLPYKNMITKVLDNEPCLVRIQKNEIQRGDILLMTLHHFSEPMHIAFYVGPTIIHAYASTRCVVEHSMTAEWKSRIRHAYRISEPLNG